MDNSISIGEATYRITRQFDPKIQPSQLILEQLIRKDLPPAKSHHIIDSSTAPEV